MIFSTLFRNWWGILIQGILMIALSILIFNNPVAVLSTIALYLGVLVIISGLVGVIAYFINSKEERSFASLIGNAVILIIGLLMILNMFVTIKAITIAFGLLVSMAGLVLVTGSFKGKNQWSLWWVIALLGIASLITGIKCILDIYSGAENISNLIGIAVLISGIGLVCLSILKKKIVMTVKNKVQSLK